MAQNRRHRNQGILQFAEQMGADCGARAVTGLAAAATTGVEIQVRIVEEPHLDKTHGPTYRNYAHRVGRFVPAVGRLPAT